MDTLSGKIEPADSVMKEIQDSSTVLKFSLKSFAGTSFYEAMSMDGNIRIPAGGITSGNTAIQPGFEQIQEYARRWCEAGIIQVDTLRELEQWIPFGHLRKDFPIYKFYFGDEEKHQLYISSVTGEALQFTDKDKRFWAWCGAIPHWVYFTSLRQDSQLWMDVVVWLSGIGCIMCIAGITLGIRSYIKQYRKRKKWKTPYKKFAYKWHHILGFFFGLFVFTFVFSGMMSLSDVPDWAVKVHNPSIEENMYSPQPVVLRNYKLDIKKVLEAYPEEVKSIEWASFGNLPLYKAVIGNRLVTVDASSDSVRTLMLDEEAIREWLASIHSEPVKITELTEYDNYYVGLTDHLPLPVYKAEVSDADNSTYYINPENGNTRYYNTNTKVRKWAYQGLHSFKVGFLAKRPVLWNIVMWTTLTGGTLVSITGVWLGLRYIIRQCKKLKKYI
jgi:hypothetical protein